MGRLKIQRKREYDMRKIRGSKHEGQQREEEEEEKGDEVRGPQSTSKSSAFSPFK